MSSLHSNQIENERHLIFSCSCYDEHRERLFTSLKNITKIEFNPKEHEIRFITLIIKSTNLTVILYSQSLFQIALTYAKAI